MAVNERHSCWRGFAKPAQFASAPYQTPIAAASLSLHACPPPNLLTQVEVPGLPCPVLVALVRCDFTVHTIFASMHETVAVLAEFRFAVAGPLIAAVCGSLGRPASAGARTGAVCSAAQPGGDSTALAAAHVS